MSITVNGVKYGMSIYLVSVKQYSYDEYDSAVVCALDEDEALELSRELFHELQGEINIKCIGYSEVQTRPEIILSSFNAG